MNKLNWTKIKSGSYTAQLGSLYVAQEDLVNYPKSTSEQYSYTIAKEGSKWNVWADDHSESDFDQNGFKTLKEAQVYIQDHAEWYLECLQETMAEIDAQDNLAEIEAENARLNVVRMTSVETVEEVVEVETEKEVKEEAMDISEKLNIAETYVIENKNVLVKVWHDYFVINNGVHTLHYVELNNGMFQCDYYLGNIREKSITARLNTKNAIEL